MLTPFLKSHLATHGYVFAREFYPRIHILAVATAIGQAVIPPGNGRLIQELVPRASASPNTYSGIYGLDSFPHHTDLAHRRVPPRYLLLRCLKGYMDVSTLLIDGQRLIESVTLDILTRAIFKPRRPQGGAIGLLRLCELTDCGICLRWDEVFLKPASRVGELADQYMRSYLSRANSTSISLTRPGDTLMIDNWRMLHARMPIPAGQEDRRIERVYLESLH